MTETIRRNPHGFSCRTRRTETFQEVVGSLIRPAIVIADRADSYAYHVEHLRLEQLEITLLRYGNAVEVDLRELGQRPSDLVLQLLVAGSSVSFLDDVARRVALSCSKGHLVGSDTPMRVRCERNSQHFLVRFDRSALQRAALTLGQSLQLPDPRDAVPLVSPAGRALRRYARYLVSELTYAGPLQTSGQFVRATQQSLLALMLDAFASAPDAVGSGRIVATPTCVRRAEEFMEAHLSDDIGLLDIVASAGVSHRTLYRGFEQARGQTPLAFLRERRLERAHADLLDCDVENVRVTDVAFRWGFLHLSAFASRYRAKFGCLPSYTLALARSGRQR